MLSCPSTVKAPSRVASTPTLIVLSSAWAAVPKASIPAAVAASRVRLDRPFMDILPPSMAGALFGPPGLPLLLPPAGGGTARSRPASRFLPEAEEPVGRDQHDDQESQADERVEALRIDQVDGEVAQQHEERRADEGADGVAQAPQHGDHEDVDDRADIDGPRRDAAVEPDIEDATERGEDPGEAMGHDPVEVDI